jgi:hypothetical protein
MEKIPRHILVYLVKTIGMHWIFDRPDILEPESGARYQI